MLIFLIFSLQTKFLRLNFLRKNEQFYCQNLEYVHQQCWQHVDFLYGLCLWCPRQISGMIADKSCGSACLLQGLCLKSGSGSKSTMSLFQSRSSSCFGAMPKTNLSCLEFQNTVHDPQRWLASGKALAGSKRGVA